MTAELIIRPETEADHDAVRRLHTAAFPTPAEATLVDNLRLQASPLVSLVAEQAGQLVGHILFSPVTLTRQDDLALMGLAPMAVVPEQQNTGIGSALVEAGLEACRDKGICAVVVLGHPSYYPRFGFAPASGYDIDSDYDVPDEIFMALELETGALANRAGRIHYHPVFESL